MRLGADVSLPRQTFRHATGLAKGQPRRFAYFFHGGKLVAALDASERNLLLDETAQGVHQGSGTVRFEPKTMEDVSHGTYDRFLCCRDDS